MPDVQGPRYPEDPIGPPIGPPQPPVDDPPPPVDGPTVIGEALRQVAAIEDAVSQLKHFLENSL